MSFRPWWSAWATPTPPHVVARLAPLRGEDCALVRPYALVETTLQLRTLRCNVAERPRAGALDQPSTEKSVRPV
ncbi:hypothetical protein [Streptomyces sp. NBC_00690]|uniref:hypothetical protein n=1 Tax=Streptomyces sp. NBC_00690 TaxID=2975808 RepID=UPI002E2D54FA|nr:hypothetical protein [Streptomyces sp. NBC_00690]